MIKRHLQCLDLHIISIMSIHLEKGVFCIFHGNGHDISNKMGSRIGCAIALYIESSSEVSGKRARQEIQGSRLDGVFQDVKILSTSPPGGPLGHGLEISG